MGAMPDDVPPPTPPQLAPTGEPSVGARVIAFVAIVVGGAAGGFIGWSFVDLQCEGDCTLQAGLGGLAGAALAAVGVGIVTVLALRAMDEWKTIQARTGGAPDPTRDRRDPRIGRKPPRVR